VAPQIPSSASICERLALGYKPSEIRDRITLSWHNLNVHVKLGKSWYKPKGYVEEQPLHILKNGKQQLITVLKTRSRIC